MESRHITKLNQVNTFEIKKVSYLVITVHKYTHEQYMHNIPARAKSKTTYIYPSSPIRTYFASNFIPSWGIEDLPPQRFGMISLIHWKWLISPITFQHVPKLYVVFSVFRSKYIVNPNTLYRESWGSLSNFPDRL